MSAPDSLERILRLMEQHGATRVAFRETDGSSMDVERPFIEPIQGRTVSASPGKPVPTGADPEEPKDLMCPCSHSLETEHNAAGCLLGCSVEKCLEQPHVRPEP